MLLNELLIRMKNNTDSYIKYGNKYLTYSEWHTQSVVCADKINSLVYKTSHNIAIFFPNSIDYAVSYFGVILADKTVIPIGITSSKIEICSTINYCEVDLILTTEEFAGNLSIALREYNQKIIIYCVDSERVIVSNENNELILKSKLDDLSDVAIMLHTSGTISDPKRVMLTHNNLISNIESNIASLNLTKNEIVLIALPMMFGYCNTAQFLTHLYLGANIVIYEGIFSPSKFWRIVESEKITNFTAVPSMLLMLIDHNDLNGNSRNSLKYICFGGGVFPKEKLRQLIYKYPHIGFVHTYGQTEASPRITALLPENSIAKLCSVGKPILGVEVRIKKIMNAQFGEILVRGKNVMKGYFKKDKLTSETVKNGWLHTGDLGYLDEEGFLYLAGREKNVVISGGLNIYPEEIEEILMAHNVVVDAFVFGVDHNTMGEVLHANVITNGDLSEKELKEHCKEKLSEYKVPKRIFVVEEILKTYNGKTKRRKFENE